MAWNLPSRLLLAVLDCEHTEIDLGETTHTYYFEEPVPVDTFLGTLHKRCEGNRGLEHIK